MIDETSRFFRLRNRIIAQLRPFIRVALRSPPISCVGGIPERAHLGLALHQAVLVIPRTVAQRREEGGRPIANACLREF